MPRGWLYYHSPLDDHPGAGDWVNDGLEWQLNDHTAAVHDLCLFAGWRLADCFAGEIWLRKRFPKNEYPQVFLALFPQTYRIDAPEVRRSLLWSMGQTHEYAWELALPASWLREPADGYVAFKLLEAGLAALEQIGQSLDIRLPELRKPNAAAAARMEPIPFEGMAAPDWKALPESAWLDRRYEGLEEGDLLIIGRGDATTPERRGQHAVVDALGGVHEEMFSGQEVSLTCWTAPSPLSD